MTADNEFRADQATSEDQSSLVDADTFSPAAITPVKPMTPPRRGDKTRTPTNGDPKPGSASSASDKPEQPAANQPRSDAVQGTLVGGWLLDPTLAMLADLVDDLEGVRKASNNRLGALTRSGADSDGYVRGLGLDERHPAVRRVMQVSLHLEAAEHGAILGLQAAMRAHPLGPWVKSQTGVGEKQAARLLASIGDPYWNSLHDRPRTVSELWAYCGLHVLPASQLCPETHKDRAGGSSTPGGGEAQVIRDLQTTLGVAPTRARGQHLNWNADARMRAWNVAQSCIKSMESPYRAVYDEGRAKYADAVHNVDCKRCGPAGKPALAGTPLSAGHQHARAVRLQMKAILKDLWIASRDLYVAHEQSPAAMAAAESIGDMPQGTSAGKAAA